MITSSSGIEKSILRIENIVKGFGGLKVLDDCSFEVEEGRIVGLIGPNGAGKTTLFDVISGVIRSDGGRILFKEKDLTSLKPYEIAQQGIGRTFQITRIFPKMTLLENMTVIATVERAEERVLELLELAELIDLKDEYASNLSFGQEKLLSLIRVLMFSPSLVLLDEPAAGINPTMQNKIMDLIHRLNDDGVSFLIIEHDMDVIMGHCEKIVTLNFGRKIAEGTPDDIRTNKEVLEAYFGRG